MTGPSGSPGQPLRPLGRTVGPRAKAMYRETRGRSSAGSTSPVRLFLVRSVHGKPPTTSTASSAAIPPVTRRPAATIPERPTLCRQWFATFFPSASAKSRDPRASKAHRRSMLARYDRELGTRRNGCLRMGGLAFATQAQLIGFVFLEQRNNNIQARLPPCQSLVIEPVPAARALDDSQPPPPWARYPVQVGIHESLSIISRGRRLMSTLRSRRTLRRWCPSKTVPSRRTFSEPGWPAERRISRSAVDTRRNTSSLRRINVPRECRDFRSGLLPGSIASVVMVHLILTKSGG